MLLVSAVAAVLISTQYSFAMGRLQLRVRAAIATEVNDILSRRISTELSCLWLGFSTYLFFHPSTPSQLFSHLLRVPQRASAGLAGSTGRVVNLVDCDLQRVLDATSGFHEFWSLPVQVVGMSKQYLSQTANIVICNISLLCVSVAISLLYRVVGISFLAGLVVMYAL